MSPPHNRLQMLNNHFIYPLHLKPLNEYPYLSDFERLQYFKIAENLKLSQGDMVNLMKSKK
ncbi:hypothetical protein CANARDRAFT_30455 [[Candida] arabinofermentans NRRL YB-2248]|uniref:Uncharacterized protein n=1 Tax=[Candida] arabinofermentans NRRL YB-2248 TaxID=983967 RepID=A0A1E4SU06_9ASCO|nr:hypothetical protein CANARDRAFT_30455 [[Candida] arabinofermentans NRRL YB-2248]